MFIFLIAVLIICVCIILNRLDAKNKVRNTIEAAKMLDKYSHYN